MMKVKVTYLNQWHQEMPGPVITEVLMSSVAIGEDPPRVIPVPPGAIFMKLEVIDHAG